MNSIVDAIKNTVSISQFNRGLAGKIFDEVNKTGPKIVIKNNIPEVVLVPTDEYVRNQEELEDLRLLLLATERFSNSCEGEYLSQETVDSVLGISEADLSDFDEVDIE